MILTILSSLRIVYHKLLENSNDTNSIDLYVFSFVTILLLVNTLEKSNLNGP